MRVRYVCGSTLESLFDDCAPEEGFVTVRLTIFGDVQGASEYLRYCHQVADQAQRCFGAQGPVWSFVAQPPLESRFAMEITQVDSPNAIAYKSEAGVNYIVLDSGPARWWFIGGVRGDIESSVAAQSDEIFSKISTLLRCEGLVVDDIVRQWNYIGKITQEQSGLQNYQAFNDSRSRFYAPGKWPDGYPAATGIGTQVVGVVVDVDIAKGLKIRTVDNPLQVAAHAYSPKVLVGDTGKTTPKFERAKVVGDTLYVSGTAAIRGELSLIDVGIAQQSVMTMENVEQLLDSVAAKAPRSIRVYLKRADYFADAKQEIESRWGGVEALYLIADVCRQELMIEIEGLY